MAMKRLAGERTRGGWLLTHVVAPVAAVVLVGACLFGWLLFAYASQGDAPSAVVRAFCLAETQQDYQAALAQLDLNGLGESGNDFIQWSQQRDQQIGTVENCVLDGRNYFRELDPYGAAFDVTAVFSSGKSYSAPISLHKYIDPNTNQLVWAIFDIDQGLHLA